MLPAFMQTLKLRTKSAIKNVLDHLFKKYEVETLEYQLKFLSHPVMALLFFPYIAIVSAHLIFVRGQFRFVECFPKFMYSLLPFLKSREQYCFLLRNIKQFEKSRQIKIQKYSPMVYCIYNSLFTKINGYTVRTQCIAEAFQQNQIDVSVLELGRNRKFKRSEERFIDGVKYIFPSIEGSRSNAGLPEVMQISDAIEKYVVEHNIKILQAASDWENALPGLMTSKKLNIPFVYEMRGLWHLTKVLESPEWEKSDQFKLASQMERHMARNSDRILTISEALKRYVVSNYEVDENKVSVLSNSTSEEVFLRGEDKQKDSEILNLGYLGSLIEYEGLEVLIEAVEILKAQNLKIHLFIGGEGRLSDKLKGEVEKRGLNGEVTFLGRIPRSGILDFYKKVNLMLYPRIRNQLTDLIPPMKIMEALSYSTPVLTSRLDPILELSRDIRPIIAKDLSSAENVSREVIALAREGTIGGCCYQELVVQNSWTRKVAELYI